MGALRNFRAAMAKCRAAVREVYLKVFRIEVFLAEPA
jgi:hypothetical protein